ncbi:uncharacterized protein F4812DRAFT_439858 [Daldinia caldariorum]|uniref:uncharacterized protein n=1 Tax=Daldinia caldariorum TaxID=326644 RepID=UPI0020086151|nr:uncharacterized protein F4812DRAFT_439858 [Daldinia caldariorum]KAI1465162.1 hypothetical protein F4812DRAFT_439858 [Daldinia caldariorum]
MAVQTTTTAASASEANPSPTAMPSFSVLTLTQKELTTTFTPPSSCAEMHLTQLSSPVYQLWLNEPQPVPSSKFGECYPSGYINGYTSIGNASSSIAPMFSPLVCPEGWNTARAWPNGYIACCADGFQLHAPDKPVDTNRPAYGGTCYSTFTIGQTVKVTAYDTESLTATADWVASATNDQAYAHPIDGFALTSDDSDSSGLSGGAIAGIVIGVLVFVAAILVGLLFFFKRYRQKRTLQTTPDGLQQDQQQPAVPQEQWSNKEPIASSPATAYTQSPYTATPGGYEIPTPPYQATGHYELDSSTPNELDSGWAGGELESHETPAQKRY